MTSYRGLTISEAMEKITNNKYILPSIQREFVWKPKQIEDLFDSLMQGYPIGTFLFWEIDKKNIGEFDFYKFINNYHERDCKHNERIDLKGHTDGITAILDGQQRLTSIYIGLKGTFAYKLKYKRNNNDNAYPARKLYLNLLAEAKDDDKKFDFRFLIPSDVKNDGNNYWFEVGEILDMETISSVSRYVSENIYRSKNGFTYTDDQASFAMDTLPALWNIIKSEEAINYYLAKSDKLDKVLDIFVRVNSGGTKLSYSDLLLSISSAQWETDARGEITKLVDDVNNIGNKFKISKDFIMRSMLVLTDLPVAFKVENFNKENTAKIEKNWDNIKRAIIQTVKLVSSFGYSDETLSSYSALIPIAYYLLSKGIPDNFVYSGKYKDDRVKIKKWLISALLKKQFSGQPANVIKKIRDIIKENTTDQFPLEEIIEKFKGTDKTIVFTDDDIDGYLKCTYKESETLSILMLLYPSLDFTNIFHIDHMYPKSKFNKNYLLKMEVSAEDIPQYIDAVNNISNLQLLDGIVNEEKNNEDFDKWFNEKYPTEEEKSEQRRKHYMPNMEYTYLNFLEFTDRRRESLKSKLQELLK